MLSPNEDSMTSVGIVHAVCLIADSIFSATRMQPFSSTCYVLLLPGMETQTGFQRSSVFTSKRTMSSVLVVFPVRFLLLHLKSALTSMFSVVQRK